MKDSPIPSSINCLDEDEWFNFVNSLGDEHTLVDFINKYLITKQQRQYLFDWFLSVEDCLNGRYTDHLYNLFIKDMYLDWNTKLGEKRFF